MNLKKVIHYIVLIAFLINVNAAYALVYKMSLLTKKLKNGTTHCIWNLYLVHESHLEYDYGTKRNISQNDKKAILKWAKKLNADVFIEADVYNQKKGFLRSLANTLHKSQNLENTVHTNPDLLINLYTYLKENEVKVHNVELRQDIIMYRKLAPYININRFDISKKSKFIINRTINILIDKISIPIIQKLIPNIEGSNNTILIETLKTYVSEIISLILAKKAYNIIHKTKSYPYIAKTVQVGLITYVAGLVIATIIYAALHRTTIESANKRIDESDQKNILKKLCEQLKQKDHGSHPSSCDPCHYSYLNDILTIGYLLEKERRTENTKYTHSIIVTGGYHSERVEQALVNHFDYLEKFSTKVPKIKKYSFDSSRLPDVILNIRGCFAKGLKVLKKEQQEKWKQQKLIQSIAGIHIPSHIIDCAKKDKKREIKLKSPASAVVYEKIDRMLPKRPLQLEKHAIM